MWGNTVGGDRLAATLFQRQGVHRVRGLTSHRSRSPPPAGRAVSPHGLGSDARAIVSFTEQIQVCKVNTCLIKICLHLFNREMKMRVSGVALLTGRMSFRLLSKPRLCLVHASAFGEF